MAGLPALPRIERLHLADLTLPDWHPRVADGRLCPVFAFLVLHPDGPVLVDTGTGRHPVIDDLYSPAVTDVVSALHAAGVDERDVAAVVNTHLHFDHCGQNPRFYATGTPVYVQGDEVGAAAPQHYTVPEWAAVPAAQLRSVAGEETIAAGLRILPTPGHTPGHQSLVVETADETVVIAGQCAYTCAEFDAAEPAAADLHDETWSEVGRDSLRRLRALHPAAAHLSHDGEVWRPTPGPAR